MYTDENIWGISKQVANHMHYFPSRVLLTRNSLLIFVPKHNLETWKVSHFHDAFLIWWNLVMMELQKNINSFVYIFLRQGRLKPTKEESFVLLERFLKGLVSWF